MKKLTWLLTPIFSIGLATAGDLASGKEVVGKEIAAPCVIEPCLVYDFIDVSYIYTDFGSQGVDDGHGVGVNLSKGLFGNVYATASGVYQDSEIGHSDADFYGGSIGLGYIIPVSDALHLNIEAGGTYSGIEADYVDHDKYGGFAGVGFRYCVNPAIELFGNAYYVHCEGGDNTWDFNAGAVFNVCEGVGVKVEGLYNPDYEDYTLAAGVRFYY